MKGSYALGCCLGYVLLASRAAAHAPPEASDVRWIGATGAERAVVRTNRGLIFQGTAPQSFSLACNDAFFVSLTETPPIAALDDGRLLIGTYEAGLLLSSIDACEYAVVGGPIAGINTVDVARGPGGFYAAVLPIDGGAAQLFSSTDGESFGSIATLSSIPNALGLAASDPQRVYISASVVEADKNAALLLASTDGGRNFVEYPITLGDTELRAFVGVVDPSDPDRVFVRTESRDGVAPERLLLSEDGGAMFQPVLSAGGPIVVHVASDAVWAGTADGLYRSTDRGHSFTPRGPAFITHIGCVSVHEGAIYICAYSESQHLFGVLTSSDDGNTFNWFLQFADVKTRISCPPNSLEGAFCAGPFADWSVEQGITSANTSAGSNGGMSSAAAGAPTGLAGGTGAASSAPSVARHDSACSVAWPASRASGSVCAAAMLGAAGVLWLRRRRI